MSAFVYAIENPGGPVKIGWSTKPDERLVALRYAYGDQLEIVHTEAVDSAADALRVERECHDALRDQRLFGEWFDVTAEEARAAICDAVQTVSMPILDPAACRAARALAGMNQQDLANAAEVGIQTLKLFETKKATPLRSVLERIQKTLEAAGVILLGGESPGVQWAATGEGVRLATATPKPKGRRK